MDNSNRIEYIDIFRGAGIVLMVMGHIGFGGYFDIFIHAFHMPMFFFISGFLFKHKKQDEVTISGFVKKKAKALLIPYFAFGTIFYIVELVTMEISIDPLLHLLWINTGGLPIAGALWFLTALFITEVLYFFIDRYISKDVIKWIIVIIISVFGNLAGIILPFTLPYATGAAMVGVGFFHVGYSLRKNENNRLVGSILNMKWYMWGISACLVTVLIFVNGYVNMRSQEYGIIPLFWINAILATLVGMNLARYVYQVCKKNIIARWLMGIGRDSIIYVCLNQFVLLIIDECIMIATISMLEKVIKKGILFCGIFAVLYLCTLLITKTKLRILIGRYD